MMNQQVFFYREEGVLKRINLNEIELIEAAGNYIRLYSHTTTFIVRISLDAALNQLPKNLFVQIHRSIVVSVEYITTIGKDYLTIVSAPNHVFPVSKTYYAGLMKKIRILEAGSGNDKPDEGE